MKKTLSSLALLLTLWFTHASAEVIDIPFGNESATRTLLASTPNPKAVVILLIGGDGKAVIFNNGTARSNHTFIRSQNLWSQYGIDSVVVDSADDLSATGGGRQTDPYQNRLLSVVNFYKHKLGVPVWIFGHSNGTISVTEFVNRFGHKKAIAGFVVAGTADRAILNDDSDLPALAIHHLKDTCSVTPISASENVIKSRPKGTRAEFITMDGGTSQGNVCWAFAYHGFNQKEDELVKSAATFILK
jgi:hypothetical protein